ncbi:jg4758 [Pararge aegeria aegeria]|uniref:Jg4758 protein n=1 Tax=Pararge aegeria aegeria TaxID=348720 RepID=A0A8S4R5J9_9NEOP|nr:jg4758 [Pararge aegeria aegeria]
MGGVHSSENGLTLESQGAAMPARHSAQRWSTSNEVDGRHQARRGSTKLWNLELPSKYLCPAVDVYKLI